MTQPPPSSASSPTKTSPPTTALSPEVAAYVRSPRFREMKFVGGVHRALNPGCLLAWQDQNGEWIARRHEAPSPYGAKLNLQAAQAAGFAPKAIWEQALQRYHRARE